STLLVRQGNERGPLGRPGSGAAENPPAVGGDRIVDPKAGLRVRVVRDIGDGPLSRSLDASLIGRLGLVLADAATAAAPAVLALIIPKLIEIQGRATDGQDVRRVSRVFSRRALGAGGSHERDPSRQSRSADVAVRRRQEAVVAGLVENLVTAPAHGDGHD